MITLNGYTKEETLPPEGIVVTFGTQMMLEKGGILNFLKYFEKSMTDPGSCWLHKSRGKPQKKFEKRLLYIYVIVCGQIKYRAIYGGHESGPVEVGNNNGCGSNYSVVSWPRFRLEQPLIKAPPQLKEKLKFSGFQGMRYCEKLF